jgi:nicotinate-nucleotide adenylyltransferase
MPSRRVGLLGGTFDPPHVAHLVVAVEVREALGLDEVRLVVANDPWQKSALRRVTPAGTRLRLARAAVGDVPGLGVSDVEVRHGGPSYTTRTLRSLRADEPGTEWFLILGADAAARLDTWHDADDLLDLCTLVVVDRPGTPVRLPLPAGSPPPERVAVTSLDVSSTDLRRRARTGRSVRFLVPDAVAAMITGEGLYLRD